MPWFIVRKRRIVRRRSATSKSKAEYKVLAPAARARVAERLNFFNRHYGFVFGKVFIRNGRTRWGTCSALGNLGFNYRIIKLPPELQDYIVVHELCHLAHMNHSADFWARVAEAIPDWKQCRKNLRKYHLN
jgi:predicted metal-dependent hydrolase